MVEMTKEQEIQYYAELMRDLGFKMVTYEEYAAMEENDLQYVPFIEKIKDLGKTPETVRYVLLPDDWSDLPDIIEYPDWTEDEALHHVFETFSEEFLDDEFRTDENLNRYYEQMEKEFQKIKDEYRRRYQIKEKLGIIGKKKSDT
jgi:hypothetical protein